MGDIVQQSIVWSVMIIIVALVIAAGFKGWHVRAIGDLIRHDARHDGNKVEERSIRRDELAFERQKWDEERKVREIEASHRQLLLTQAQASEAVKPGEYTEV